MTACEKEISFDYDEVEPLVMIEGRVTNEGTEVLISRTRSVYDPVKPKGLRGAEVTVSTEGGEQERLTYDEATGYYRSPLKGRPGTTYRLTVELEGRHYEATSLMYPPAPLTGAEFLWQSINQERMLAYELWAKDPQPDVRNYYWYRVDRTSLHPHFANRTTREAYRWNVFDDRGCPPGLVMRDVLCMSERTAIDRATYDYLHSLRTGQQNGANPAGNISGDNCLGYFTAASVTHADTLVFSYDAIRSSR